MIWQWVIHHAHSHSVVSAFAAWQAENRGTGNGGLDTTDPEGSAFVQRFVQIAKNKVTEEEVKHYEQQE